MKTAWIAMKTLNFMKKLNMLPDIPSEVEAKFRGLENLSQGLKNLVPGLKNLTWGLKNLVPGLKNLLKSGENTNPWKLLGRLKAAVK